MTAEQFYEQINRGCYPKYIFSQIKEGTPDHDCIALVCTSSDNVLIAKYENGKWQQAHFISTRFGDRQKIYYDDIEGDVIYWTDGTPEDYSKE